MLIYCQELWPRVFGKNASKTIRSAGLFITGCSLIPWRSTQNARVVILKIPNTLLWLNISALYFATMKRVKWWCFSKLHCSCIGYNLSAALHWSVNSSCSQNLPIHVSWKNTRVIKFTGNIEYVRCCWRGHVYDLSNQTPSISASVCLPAYSFCKLLLTLLGKFLRYVTT